MAQSQQYLTFGIGKETFGIKVDQVKEILDPGPISRLPRAPDFLIGLMDVRGVSMPIVDLRIRFGLEPSQMQGTTRVIILEHWGTDRADIGFAADRVYEVTDLGGGDLQPPPSVGQRWRSDCVTGIGRRGEDFVIILDLDCLIDVETLLVEAAV